MYWTSVQMFIFIRHGPLCSVRTSLSCYCLFPWPSHLSFSLYVIFQACGLIHTVNGQYIAALDSYMSDVHEPIHAFAFINNMLLELIDMEPSYFQSAVVSRIPELVKLSR